MIMTPQEKAAAYDMAIERTRRMIEDYKNRGLDNYYACAKESLEKIFPELRESEDERIKEALIRFHKSTIDIDGIKGDDIVAWLEKQGEQKQKIQPKFKVGDQVEYIGERKEFDENKHVIKSICDGIYITTFDKKIPFKFQDNYRLIEETKQASSIIDIDKMVEEWKRSTRFYGTSDILAYRQGLNDAISKVVLKPAEWSEEDIMMKDEIINVLQKTGNYEKEINWLKSRKERSQKGE